MFPKVIGTLAALYLIALFLGWGWLATDDGTHLPSILFLMGPRWIVAVPLLLLIPITAVTTPRWLVVYPLHGALILFALCDFELPNFFPTTTEPGTRLNVMTCNLGGGEVKIDRVVEVILQNDMDLLFLQESPNGISSQIFARLGWSFQQVGNMSIGSRYPTESPQTLARHSESHFRTVAAMACTVVLGNADEMNQHEGERGDAIRIEVVCVHLPTFRPALRQARDFDQAAWKTVQTVAAEYRNVADQIYRESGRLRPEIIAGDFNVPVESAHYRDYWHGYRNAHNQAGIGFGFTKFTQLNGVRIDHVLTTPNWFVDTSTVAASVGSDHRPVLARIIRAQPPRTRVKAVAL